MVGGFSDVQAVWTAWCFCSFEYNGNLQCMQMRQGHGDEPGGTSGRSHCDGAISVLLFTCTGD